MIALSRKDLLGLSKDISAANLDWGIDYVSEAVLYHFKQHPNIEALAIDASLADFFDVMKEFMSAYPKIPIFVFCKKTELSKGGQTYHLTGFVNLRKQRFHHVDNENPLSPALISWLENITPA